MKNKTFELFSKYKSLIMGLATISVLLFHYTDDMRRYKVGFEGIARLYNLIISSGGVDIFLLMAGLGCYYSWKKNSNYKEFIKNRMIRILIPYIIISIPAHVINNYVFLDGSFLNLLEDIFFINLFKYGRNWFWYIFFILVCYIIFPYLYNLINSKKNNYEIEETLLNVFTFTTVMGILLTLRADDLFSNINIMLLRIPVFVFGIYLGKLSYNKEKIDNKWIAFFVIALVVSPLKLYNRILLSRYVVGFINVVIVFMFVQIMEFLEKKNIKLSIIRKILNFFGRYSLEIYLLHVTLRSFFIKCGYPTYILKYEIIMIIFTLILSFIVKFITNKIQILMTKRVRFGIIK